MLEHGYGRSLGASCLVFGLLAVCAVWAPVNEFDVISRWGAFEWPVLTVAAVFIAKEFLGSLLSGGAISTPMLHLFGAVAGFVLGLSMLIVGLVDCEGYDLVSHVSGEKFEPWTVMELMPGHAERQAAEKKKKEELAVAQAAAAAEAARPKWQVASPSATASGAEAADWLGVAAEAPELSGTGRTPSLAAQDAKKKPQSHPPLGTNSSGPAAFDPPPAPQSGLNGESSWLESMDLPEAQKPEELIEAAVTLGDFSGALRQLSAMIRADRGFKPAPMVLNRLAEGLIQSQQADSALKVLAFAISRYPANANRWKLRAARILLTVRKDPVASMAMLKSVNRQDLDDVGCKNLDAMIRATQAASQPKD